MKDLKKLRRAAGLSQFALARVANVPRWRIAYAETGSLDLDAVEVARIRAAVLETARRNTQRIESKLNAGIASAA